VADNGKKKVGPGVLVGLVQNYMQFISTSSMPVLYPFSPKNMGKRQTTNDWLVERQPYGVFD
jgi:hypothetical protein